ncbi:class I tRNA ligase family protein, partial [Candidatus Babeliales bacterium]|nr:class I tRNA ligase family protein [Candidatus Babeliales bacterium]
HDIIRTWAFYTIVMAHYHNNTIPWKKAVISGHVLAGNDKLSKSGKTSKMTPEYLLSTYSADAIRYWAAGGRLGTDTAFSEMQLKSGQRLVTKLWNAFRFCSEHLQNYEVPKTTPTLSPLSKWLLHRFNEEEKRYHKYFAADDYTGALDVSEHFFWHIFCDYYLEMVKDQLFNPDKYSVDEIASTRFTLYEVGLGILQLYAPFAAFVTENIYQELFKSSVKANSLHLTQFDVSRYSDYVFADEANQIELVCTVLSQVRKQKSEHSLSLKTEIATLELCSLDEDLAELVRPHETLLKGVTKAQNIVYGSGACRVPAAEKDESGNWTFRAGLEKAHSEKPTLK